LDEAGALPYAIISRLSTFMNSSSRRRAALALGAAVLLAGAAVQADIYKHVDENGVVGFSNKPGSPGKVYVKTQTKKSKA
jgi:ABC-type cobalamin transport system permease subunit